MSVHKDDRNHLAAQMGPGQSVKVDSGVHIGTAGATGSPADIGLPYPPAGAERLAPLHLLSAQIVVIISGSVVIDGVINFGAPGIAGVVLSA